MNKRQAQRRHARQRAWERHGINLGPATRRQIVRAIQQQRSTIVEKQSNRVTVHDVRLDDNQGPTLRVVYDKFRAEIVTVLPPERGGN